jgi:acetyl-CoA carboxylase carboxyl transferase subunit beta
MSWYKRLREGISTATKSKKDVPEGIWFQCKNCKQASTTRELRDNFYKCPKCDYHTAIGSEEYFDLLFDGHEYTTLFDNLISVDFLKFTDLKPYDKRLEETMKKTGLNDAIAVGEGKVNGYPLVVACYGL